MKEHIGVGAVVLQADYVEESRPPRTARLAHPWIPIHDDKPPAHKEVLLWDGARIFITWWSPQLSGTRYHVTHWQPLPEPPA